MIAFSSLLAAERQWSPVWLFFSVFAASLVVARLFLGHVPDRLGGARVALVSVLIEAGGLLLIWLAPAQIFGVAGALLTGLGFALVYPASASRPSAARRRKAAALPWARTLRSSTWRLDLAALHWDGSRDGPGWVQCFLQAP